MKNKKRMEKKKLKNRRKKYNNIKKGRETKRKKQENNDAIKYFLFKFNDYSMIVKVHIFIVKNLSRITKIQIFQRSKYFSCSFASKWRNKGTVGIIGLDTYFWKICLIAKIQISFRDSNISLAHLHRNEGTKGTVGKFDRFPGVIKIGSVFSKVQRRLTVTNRKCRLGRSQKWFVQIEAA